MIRSWALATMLLLLAASCDGETFFLGEKHESDANDEDSEPAADAGPSAELDAAHEEGDAGESADADARSPDARSDARSPFEAGMADADAAQGDAELDDNAWAFCDWITACPSSRPYCNAVVVNQSSVWVCLECDLYASSGCQTGETCLLSWNLVRPQAACVPVDAGRPPPPRGNGSGT